MTPDDEKLKALLDAIDEWMKYGGKGQWGDVAKCRAAFEPEQEQEWEKKVKDNNYV